MGHQERMDRIEEHFRSVSVNEVEASLVKAGIDRIAPAARFHMTMLTEEDLRTNFRYDSTNMHGYRLREGFQTFVLSPVSLRPEDAA
ncbi:hypothetical protein RB620_14660 [Paenibacillus sp. LHD-117]|uniref:hypothetical protein n=1 Tax=Paenibacillus sp. LHD-117 TaxID=3071412 RepID=UPI0027DF0B96|nr:hypothetical protein [Paenibacillus sp. LHD-117]MDQ6420669.1 hypothetical protein [Paenibacillus sp. LHD-117]